MIDYAAGPNMERMILEVLICFAFIVILLFLKKNLLLTSLI